MGKVTFPWVEDTFGLSSVPAWIILGPFHWGCAWV